MKYLLVNHIASHAGRDTAHVKLPRAWARDVLAATRAAREAGVNLFLATPTTEAAAPDDSIELVPDEAGFEHLALPLYASARSFLRERKRLVAKLRATMTAADIVQLDLGGHPMPLGLVADPSARDLGKSTLWIVDRSPELRPGSRSKHAAKRAVGRTVGGSVRRSLAEALRASGGVIATNESVADEVRALHVREVQLVESIDLLDAELPTAESIADRHTRLLESARPLKIVVLSANSVDRGLSHVLAAMHRCWRLRAPVELVASSRGSETQAIRRQAEELGLTAVVTLVDEPGLDRADLVVDAALTNAARSAVHSSVARGTPAIAYAPASLTPGVITIERGAVDKLAEAVFRAATDRPSLVNLMLAGQSWAKTATLDAAHRRRFDIAREIVARRRGARGAA